MDERDEARTESVEGKHLRNTLERTRDGNHSATFHAPVEEPHTWPRRTITGRSAVCADATLSIFSATHLASVYPVLTAADAGTSSSFTGSLVAPKGGRSSLAAIFSGLRARGVPATTPTELTNRTRGGVGRCDDRARSTKFLIVFNCDSKDNSDRLKLTGHAGKYV